MEFSVLMLVYNGESAKHFKEAIESILNQTLLPNEIVIIKDGPLTTSLEEVLLPYKDRKEFNIYSFDKRRGAGIARYDGVNLCRFEYIAQMDSDDIAVCDRFERQIEYLKLHSEVDILGGFIREYDENMQRIIGIRKVPLSDEKIRRTMGKRCEFNHCTVMFKKSVILGIGNYRDVYRLEDYDLWIRLLHTNCVMANLEDILVNVRGGDSLHKRRSGLKYAKNIYKLERESLKHKNISISTFLTNIITRITLAVMPQVLRRWIYENMLRDKDEISNCSNECVQSKK